MSSEYQTRLDELTEEFDLFDDWEQRYRYIIDLGKDLPPLASSERNEATRVRGCASQVWLVIDQTEPVLRFRGESDAFIVKGLIAVLARLLDGLPVADIRDFSIRGVLDRLGLNEALSSQRTNGLMSMAERLKAAAGGEPHTP
ncbi:MAG: SufE family protein [Asticcacaulis sp.]